MTGSRILAGLPSLSSVFGQQFRLIMENFGASSAGNSVCEVLQNAVAWGLQNWGGAAGFSTSARSAWNYATSTNGCGEPFPAAGTSASRADRQDLAAVIGAIAASGSAGPAPSPSPTAPPPGVPDASGGVPLPETNPNYINSPTFTGNKPGGPTVGAPGSGGPQNVSIFGIPIANPLTSGCKPEGWAMLPPSTTPGDVARVAVEQAPGDASYIARILNPANYQAANWAWSGDREHWRVHRGGFADRCNDPEVAIQDIDASSVSQIPRGGGTSVTPYEPRVPGLPGSGGQIVPAGGRGILPGLTPIQPNSYTVRRCPPKHRMAFDGFCYLTSILPAAFYMNKSKKAPVSWSDANAIRKADTAVGRISTYAKNNIKRARKIVPPKRRSRSRD